MDEQKTLAPVIDFLRRAQLRIPLVAKLDEIAVADPVRRCILAATIANEAVRDDPTLSGLFRGNDVVGRLKGVALSRRSDMQAADAVRSPNAGV